MYDLYYQPHVSQKYCVTMYNSFQKEPILLKKMFLKIWKISNKSTCVGVSF